MGIGEVAALVVAFGGAITGIVAWRKTQAEAESIAVATSIELVETLRCELKEVRIELEYQRKRRQDLADELHALKTNYAGQLLALRNRVDTLEHWIDTKTTTDPSTIL